MNEIKEYLETGVDKKLVLKSWKMFKEYFPGDWMKVNRTDIHDLKNGSDFRIWLRGRVKNMKDRNRVLRTLELVFEWLVMNERAEGRMVENPFNYAFDKERPLVNYGTVREKIEASLINLMILEFSKNDFQWSRDNFKEDWDGEEFCYSATVILWLMMFIPLRSMQVRWLDSGLSDEFSLDGQKNVSGVRGRREGFIRKMFNHGIGGSSLGLYVNTNKNVDGFEIPWINEEILRVIERQMDWVRSREFGPEVKRTGKSEKKVWLLFPDKNGRVVSKTKLDLLWKKFCIHIEVQLGIKLIEAGRCIYGLHCLRVSGVSLGLEGMDYEKLGLYFSGQTGDVVLYYAQMGDLKSMVREREIKKLGNRQLLLLEDRK